MYACDVSVRHYPYGRSFLRSAADPRRSVFGAASFHVPAMTLEELLIIQATLDSTLMTAYKVRQTQYRP